MCYYVCILYTSDVLGVYNDSVTDVVSGKKTFKIKFHVFHASQSEGPGFERVTRKRINSCLTLRESILLPSKSIPVHYKAVKAYGQNYFDEVNTVFSVITTNHDHIHYD